MALKANPPIREVNFVGHLEAADEHQTSQTVIGIGTTLGFLPTDGKWTLMNIDFPTQNSHRSCLSAVKRARYPLKDERRPDQGAGFSLRMAFFF